MMAKSKLSGPALAVQVGGDHYAKMVIQPAQFIMANKIAWAEGTAIAYIARWRDKGGVEDLRKARHTLDLLIEHEESMRPSAIVNEIIRGDG